MRRVFNWRTDVKIRLSQHELSSLKKVNQRIKQQGYTRDALLEFATEELVKFRGFNDFKQAQQLLYRSYPNSKIVTESAVQRGLSREIVMKLASLFTESHVKAQRTGWLDIVTSDESGLSESIIGATVFGLKAINLSNAQISRLFSDGTERRIDVLFRNGSKLPAGEIEVKIDQADDGRCRATVYGLDDADEPEPPVDGNPEGGVEAGGEQGGNEEEGGGEEEGDKPNEKPEGKPEDEDKPGLFDIFWDMFMGAGAGAAVGAMAGPEGVPVGAIVGAMGGFLKNVPEEGFGAQVMLELDEDGLPLKPNPCDSPLINC